MNLSLMDKHIILDIAILLNPDCECSIIGDIIFISDNHYLLNDYLDLIYKE